MKANFTTPPVGIIKTMPMEFFREGVEKWEKTFLKINELDNHYWHYNLPGKPKYDVLYFYLLFDGAIRFRANIIGYDTEPKIFRCYDGSDHYGRVWVQVSAPVIKLKGPIEMKGFQGFRYTTEIWQ